MKKYAKAMMLAVVGLSAMGCGDAEPVARVEVPVDRLHLEYPSSTQIPLVWTPIRTLDLEAAETFVFVHLLDDAGKVIRTFDHPYPVAWQVNVTHRYELELWQSALGPQLEPATYRLSLGLYTPDRGRPGRGHRWPLQTTGEEVGEKEYVVARVEVGSERPGPSLTFTGDWHPPDAGSQQNLGRRWLGKIGAIGVKGLRRPGDLVLHLSLTELPSDRHRLLLDDGASEPRVVVRTDCGNAEATLEDWRVHVVRLPLPAGTEDCFIQLEPNFVFLGLQDFSRRSVGLEVAYIAPGAAEPDDGAGSASSSSP